MAAPEPAQYDDTARPPRVKLPARAAKWLGPWRVVTYSTFGPKGKKETGRCWWRDFLVADGHEECCRHEEWVTRPYEPALIDGEERP